jgi:excisionase family DNA binding protein
MADEEGGLRPSLFAFPGSKVTLLGSSATPDMPTRLLTLRVTFVTSCDKPDNGQDEEVADMAKSEPLNGDRLHTVAEVADHMRVSNMTVYRLIKAGEVRAVRVGKSYRIRQRDLEAYLDASRTGFATEAHEGDR